VRRSGSSLRVATKLIDIASDSAVWTHKYSGTSEDVFTIQESISRGIVDALHLVLSPRESQRLLARPLDDIRAYESYLKAKQEMLTFTKEGLDRALSFLKNSEQLVGENLLLLSATDYVYWQYVNAGIDNDPQTSRRRAPPRNASSRSRPSRSMVTACSGLSRFTKETFREASRV